MDRLELSHLLLLVTINQLLLILPTTSKLGFKAKLEANQL